MHWKRKTKMIKVILLSNTYAVRWFCQLSITFSNQHFLHLKKINFGIIVGCSIQKLNFASLKFPKALWVRLQNNEPDQLQRYLWKFSPTRPFRTLKRSYHWIIKFDSSWAQKLRSLARSIVCMSWSLARNQFWIFWPVSTPNKKVVVREKSRLWVLNQFEYFKTEKFKTRQYLTAFLDLVEKKHCYLHFFCIFGAILKTIK